MLPRRAHGRADRLDGVADGRLGGRLPEVHGARRQAHGGDAVGGVGAGEGGFVGEVAELDEGEGAAGGRVAGLEEGDQPGAAACRADGADDVVVEGEELFGLGVVRHVSVALCF